MAHVHAHICMSHIEQPHMLFAHTDTDTPHTPHTHAALAALQVQTAEPAPPRFCLQIPPHS